MDNKIKWFCEYMKVQLEIEKDVLGHEEGPAHQVVKTLGAIEVMNYLKDQLEILRESKISPDDLVETEKNLIEILYSFTPPTEQSEIERINFLVDSCQIIKEGCLTCPHAALCNTVCGDYTPRIYKREYMKSLLK